MWVNISFQIDLRDALQGLAQDVSLELELPLVRNVLVVASAAVLKVRAPRFNAIGRRFD
jgi:hypothetical protein